VKGIGYPLHSPVSLSLPLPCVTVRHHISARVYLSSAFAFVCLVAVPRPCHTFLQRKSDSLVRYATNTGIFPCILYFKDLVSRRAYRKMTFSSGNTRNQPVIFPQAARSIFVFRPNSELVTLVTLYHLFFHFYNSVLLAMTHFVSSC